MAEREERVEWRKDGDEREWGEGIKGGIVSRVGQEGEVR